MKIPKSNSKPRSTSRKAVVQAIANQDQEVQQDLSLNDKEIQEAIRLKAYELYLTRDKNVGNPQEDWLTAEQIILQKFS